MVYVVSKSANAVKCRPDTAVIHILSGLCPRLSKKWAPQHVALNDLQCIVWHGMIDGEQKARAARLQPKYTLQIR